MAPDLKEAALEIACALRAGDKDTALRALIEFVDSYRRAGDEARSRSAAIEPPLTGSREWDALLAGVVEWLSGLYGLKVPAWTSAPERFLDAWWFLPTKSSLRALIFTETPAALANRGVFVSRTAFETV